MNKYPYWIKADRMIAISILSNITNISSSALGLLTDTQIYNQIKEKCEL